MNNKFEKNKEQTKYDSKIRKFKSMDRKELRWKSKVRQLYGRLYIQQ